MAQAFFCVSLELNGQGAGRADFAGHVAFCAFFPFNAWLWPQVPLLECKTATAIGALYIIPRLGQVLAKGQHKTLESA